MKDSVMTRFPPGTTLTIRGKVASNASGNAYMIDTPDGPVRIPESMVIASDFQEIAKDSIVESILPSRSGIKGVVLHVDGCEAWVRWSNNVPKTEKLITLRVAHIRPQ